ncbi:hypothetical protein TNCV_3180071 [Trichonephila clavipes]|nr:hypothetical protein TNCV_3180071 [Trichonephila clavipes]
MLQISVEIETFCGLKMCFAFSSGSFTLENSSKECFTQNSGRSPGSDCCTGYRIWYKKAHLLDREPCNGHPEAAISVRESEGRD